MRRYTLRTARCASPLDRAREQRGLDGWRGGLPGFKVWRSERAQRKQADIERDSTERRRRQHARSCLPASWLARNLITSPEFPPPQNLLLWQLLGAHDALMLMPPRVSTNDPRQCAAFYAIAWMATNGAYMNDEPPTDDDLDMMAMDAIEVGATRIVSIPAALAKAIVSAQAAVGVVSRDGKSQQKDDEGKAIRYSSADAISAAGKKALNDNGAAWMRLGVSLGKPTLDNFDLGKQAYVGDAHIQWAIVHESGPMLVGMSQMPVIASRGRPHDKAVQASETYDVGGTLRGALCVEREAKGATDQREDVDDGGNVTTNRRQRGDRKRDAIGPRCSGNSWTGDLGREVDQLVQDLATLSGVGTGEVWWKLVEDAGVNQQPYMDTDGEWPGRPGVLSTSDGKLVKAAALKKIADARQT